MKKAKEEKKETIANGDGQSQEMVALNCDDEKVPTDRKQPKVAKFDKYASLKGVFFCLVAAMLMPLASVLIKKASFFSGSEISLTRYFIQMLGLLLVAWYKRLNVFGTPKQRRMLTYRGISGSIGMTLIYSAYKIMDPADVQAIFNVNIIVICVFARIFLGEKLTPIHVFALFTTVSGVFFISQPTFLFPRKSNAATSTSTATSLAHINASLYNSSSNSLKDEDDDIYSEKHHMRQLIGLGMCLAAAVCASAVAILLKMLTNNKVHFSLRILYASYVGIPLTICVSCVLLYTGLEKKDLSMVDTHEKICWQVIWVIAASVVGSLGQVSMNMSYEYYEASRLSMIKTTELFFAFLFQLAFLDIYPNAFSLVGAALILVSVFEIFTFNVIEKTRDARRKNAAFELELENAKALLDGGEVIKKKKDNAFKRFVFFKF